MTESKDKEWQIIFLRRRLNEIAHNTPYTVKLESIPAYVTVKNKLKELQEMK